MIIWGTRGLTSEVQASTFHCPQCDAQRGGSLKQVRTFFTIYFIPLIPMNVAGRYVECTSCGGTFAEEILSYDPEKEREETNTQLLRVMVMAALADGGVDQDERGEIKKQFAEISGLPIPPEQLENEISLAQASGSNLNAYVSTLAPDLSPHGKALVVKLAFHTMSASGQLQPGHQTQLAELATTLQIPQDQFRELITQLSEMADD